MRLIDADELVPDTEYDDDYDAFLSFSYVQIDDAPTIEAEPVRHGRWVECDYKHLEHGMIETEPKAGLCCSYCRTAFQKKKMTYKQYCPNCGARMDGADT